MGAVTVASVHFTTADRANAQLRSHLPVPSNTLVCITEVKGTFVASGPPVPDATGKIVAHSVTTHTVYEIFDGHSGDLVTEVIAP